MSSSGWFNNFFQNQPQELIAPASTTSSHFGMLLWVEPVDSGNRLVSVWGHFTGVIYLTDTSYPQRQALARLRVAANRQRFQNWPNESPDRDQDIKLLGREISYLNRYEGPSLRMARTEVRCHFLARFPQLAFRLWHWACVIAALASC